MKCDLKIKSHRMGPDAKVIYEVEGGFQFMGPPMGYAANEPITVEVSDEPMPDGYYHIIKKISS
jgi:hypothetical protein